MDMPMCRVNEHIFVSSYKQSPKLYVVNYPNKSTFEVAQRIREFTQDLELQRKRDFELLRQYIFSVTLVSVIYNIEDAGNNVVNNDGIMEEDNNVENTTEEGEVNNIENTIDEAGVNNA
ncbi:hypothetical protein TNCT_325821 [Trichonephila clavata]|uniref:Uncharacterized protein n=1 Tax=Trichonephila clavata TaxID=2740835 RepID=A0A8X6LR57_TRICU|nr:hypothetical protein TNCT_325821 [Trichonephila clavata]